MRLVSARLLLQRETTGAKVSEFKDCVIRAKHGLEPHWDDQTREFRFGPAVVKRFKWPAKNQVQILKAFEANNWPRKIENPLPMDEKVCPKTQLHDTIKCLNRHQENPMVRFHGDGTGWGVCWSVVEENLPGSNPAQNEAGPDNNPTKQSEVPVDV